MLSNHSFTALRFPLRARHGLRRPSHRSLLRGDLLLCSPSGDQLTVTTLAFFRGRRQSGFSLLLLQLGSLIALHHTVELAQRGLGGSVLLLSICQRGNGSLIVSCRLVCLRGEILLVLRLDAREQLGVFRRGTRPGLLLQRRGQGRNTHRGDALVVVVLADEEGVEKRAVHVLTEDSIQLPIRLGTGPLARARGENVQLRGTFLHPPLANAEAVRPHGRLQCDLRSHVATGRLQRPHRLGIGRVLFCKHKIDGLHQRGLSGLVRPTDNHHPGLRQVLDLQVLHAPDIVQFHRMQLHHGLGSLRAEAEQQVGSVAGGGVVQVLEQLR